jgi:hypothetical protein
LKEYVNFLRDENTGLMFESTELKYENHNIEEERNNLEMKHSEANNEIYMLRKSIENQKTMGRQLQSEYDSIVKAYDHSKMLINTLEQDKTNLQSELKTHTKEQFSGLLSNIAKLEKNKILHHLSDNELSSINRVNKADIKSEYAQTVIADINNILIVKNPNEKDRPSIPRKNEEIQTEMHFESETYNPDLHPGLHHDNAESQNSKDDEANSLIVDIEGNEDNKITNKSLNLQNKVNEKSGNYLNTQEREEVNSLEDDNSQRDSLIDMGSGRNDQTKTTDAKYTKRIRFNSNNMYDKRKASKSQDLGNDEGRSSKTQEMPNDKYGNMMHYVRTNFNNIMDKHRQNLFSPEDLKQNDVYGRLFKDSKIKQVQNNEFCEFLKLKQSGETNQIISAKFMSKSQKLNTIKRKDFTVRNQRQLHDYSSDCL